MNGVVIEMSCYRYISIVSYVSIVFFEPDVEVSFGLILFQAPVAH